MTVWEIWTAAGAGYVVIGFVASMIMAAVITDRDGDAEVLGVAFAGIFWPFCLLAVFYPVGIGIGKLWEWGVHRMNPKYRRLF